MPHFRKKPVVIEARLFDGGWDTARDIILWMQRFGEMGGFYTPDDTIIIGTLEGSMCASVGDWVIRGVEDEFYPCKPDIFWQTYEEA